VSALPRESATDWLIGKTEALQRLQRAHYPTQGDVARMDLLQKHSACIEVGRGYVWFDKDEKKWTGGIAAEKPGAPYLEQTFDDMRDALDWMFARLPS
jgi:hypothetical protein